MIRYILKYENLIERSIHKDFKILETTDNDTIQYCIELFNSKIEWNGMFDLNEAINRINDGHKMFVGYYEDMIIGYCWCKEINNSEYYLYNLFIESDTLNRNYGGTDLLYLLIKSYTNGVIISDIDDWNTKSQNVVKKLGFIKY